MEYLIPLAVLLCNSLFTALTPQPGDDREFGPRFLRALARFSVLRHGDAPGTLHLPGRSQPTWDDVPPPKMRISTDRFPTPRIVERGSADVKAQGYLLGISLGLFALLALLGGCARTRLDAARSELTGIMQVQRAALDELQRKGLDCQLQIARAHKDDREAAARAIAAYRDRRKHLDEQIATAEKALQDATEQLTIARAGVFDAQVLARARKETDGLRQGVAALVGRCAP